MGARQRSRELPGFTAPVRDATPFGAPRPASTESQPRATRARRRRRSRAPRPDSGPFKPGNRLGTILGLIFTGGSIVVAVSSNSGTNSVERPVFEFPTYPTTSIVASTTATTTTVADG